MSQSHARRERRKAIAMERRSGKLDRYNEALVERGLHLHPTKGFRKINPRRTVAQTIVEMTLKGFGGSNVDAKEALNYAA